jgi:CubicO group peptidase (beta-lactamase class C family)
LQIKVIFAAALRKSIIFPLINTDNYCGIRENRTGESCSIFEEINGLFLGMKIILIALFALCASSAPFAQDFPHTTIGQLAGQFIQSINSGDEKQQLAFFHSYESSPIVSMGADRWMQWMTFFNQQLRGVEVVELQPSTDTAAITMTLRSKKGSYWMELRTQLISSEPGKLDGFGAKLVEDPLVTRRYQWPHKVADESAIAGEIDRHAIHLTDIGQFSGVVLVAKNDKVIFEKAYGLADQTFKVPSDTATRFCIGSMNKMFTSVAIGQLVQAGKLSYADTLAKVLPDYPNQGIAKRITIVQLLTHTSGLGDYFKNEFFTHRGNYVALRSYLPIFQDDSLLFAPGTSWSYSNAGFLVLGLVVEKVSREDYFEYVSRHIYEPAGMHHSGSYKSDSVVDNLATGYTSSGGFDPLRLKPRIMNWETLPIKGSSAGGGYATAGDFLRFSIALKNHTLLSAALTDSVLDGKVFDRMGIGKEDTYAFGFEDYTMLGKHIAGHSGGGPGMNGELRIFRDGSYTVIVLSNYDPPSATALSRQILSFLLDQ